MLSSIGAAVGLGNAVRFPGLCAKYGGGAFLTVYIVALAVLGVPLLCAEIALGRRTGGGAPKCFASLSPRGEKAGWAVSFNSLFVAVIYAGLIGWILSMAVKIFPLSLSGGGNARDYFFTEVLPSRKDGVISGFSPLVLVCILATWAAIFFCLAGGIKRVAKVAAYSVYLPLLLLLFLAVRGLFYPRCGEALYALFTPDFSAFLSPELWATALSQVFFSLSVAAGIMPAFGACLPERTNIFKCSVIISAADFCVSLLSSVVLFTTLYGNNLENSLLSGGLNTAFEVYPVALSRLFGDCKWLSAATGCAFYLSLALMAIQSAVSMAEAALSPLAEVSGVGKKRLSAVVCAVCAAVCCVCSTTAAPVLVDIGDKFCNCYLILALGAAESALIGYGGGRGGLADEINRFTGRLKLNRAAFTFSVKFVCPAALVSLTIWNIAELCAFGGLYGGYPVWAQFAFGWTPVALCALSGFAIAFFFRPKAVKRKTARKIP